MAKMVEGLLSGSFYPNFESRIKNIVDKRKSSVESVEAAIADEVARPELSQLSQREREILSLMAQGKSNSGIAKSLYITEGSVEKHISSILSKLGIAMESENHRRVLAVLKYLGIEE
jgi:DNA-binding NarL/FixJ family response regulator